MLDCKIFSFAGRLGTCLCSYTILKFLLFLHFLSHEANCIIDNSWGKLYTVFCTRYQILLYLWWIESVVKLYKIPTYFAHDCLKIFHLLFQSFIMSQISKSNSILTQENHLKTATNENGKFFLCQFWPRPNILNYALCKLLTLELLCNLEGLFLFQRLRKNCMLWQISKNLGLMGTRASYNKKFVSADNHLQNIFW